MRPQGSNDGQETMMSGRPKPGPTDYWPRVPRPAREWTAAERRRRASLLARVHTFAELAALPRTPAKREDGTSGA